MEVGALAIGTIAWIAVLTRMAFDFFRIRPRPVGRLLQGCGILLITTGLLAVFSAEVAGWIQDQQRIAHTIVLPLALAGLAIVVGGQVKRDRRSRAPRRLRRSPPTPNIGCLAAACFAP